MKRPGPNPLLLLVNCTCCGNGYKHVDQDSLVRRKGTAYTEGLQGPFEQNFGVSRNALARTSGSESLGPFRHHSIPLPSSEWTPGPCLDMNVPCPAVGKWKRQADKGKYHMASHNMCLGRNTLALVKEGNNEGQKSEKKTHQEWLRTLRIQLRVTEKRTA